MTPSNQNKTSQIAASRAGGRLFRMNVALSWAGEVVTQTADRLVLKNPRPIKSGFPGLSDGVGFVPVVITPDMVGQTVAVFLAVEDKSGKAKATAEQESFIRAVVRFGGRAGVARSEADVERIVRGEGQLLGLP